MIDPLGYLLTTIRDDTDVASITTRIRGEEMAQGDAPPFVIIRGFPIRREQHLPVARYQYMILCFGRTHKEAAQLRGVVSDAIHGVGPRVNASGVGIYRSHSEVEGQSQIDPDTQWPFQTIVAVVWAATTAVA